MFPATWHIHRTRPVLIWKPASERTLLLVGDTGFTNGAEVKFSARSKSATRGLGFRTLIFDEAQELDYLTLGATVPTLSGQGDARTQRLVRDGRRRAQHDRREQRSL